MKAADLIGRVGVERETAQSFIRGLKKKGVLKKDGQGNWMIEE